MKKLRNHIHRWNKWRKCSCNSRFHKFLVLIGFVKSPTFMYTMTDEQEETFRQFAEKWADEFHRVYAVSSDDIRAILKRAEENKEDPEC